jgi:hypothetical protein
VEDAACILAELDVFEGSTREWESLVLVDSDTATCG